MKTISLDTYQIYVGDIWEKLNQFLDKETYSEVYVLVDENTKRYCLPIYESHINLKQYKAIEINSGEKHKNIETCSSIWKQLINANADRKALFINLGGGVIGDMGGFCASTYKRGIDFIQIPTTLLSMVDSSIGGKLGIDFGEIKNSIGLFQNPQAVYIDPVFLKTLPKKEIRSGFAEIIKHGLIADKIFWQSLYQIDNLSEVDWTSVIIHSLEIKKRVVEEDPFEHGIRKALNFGHTIGHALESFALDSEKPLLHGEAIAAGMVCETYLSSKITGFSKEETNAIALFILEKYGQYTLKDEYYEDLIRLMKNDKKNQNGQINFTMLQSTGISKINQHCDEELIKESLKYYASLRG